MERRTGKIISDPVGAFLLALLSQIIWGSAFVLIKLAYKEFSTTTVGDTIMFVAVRMLIAGLILLLVTIASEKRLVLPDKLEVGSVFIIGTVQIGLVYALQFPSMIYTSSVHCSILNGSQIITATLFAHLFFKDDHITFKKGLGCLIAFAGVVFCFLYGGDIGSISFRGEGMFFLSCTSFALSSSLVRKLIKKTNPVVCSYSSLLIGGAELLVLGLASGGRLGNGGSRGWSLLIALSLISSVCFLLWNSLLKSNPVGRISVCQCINPITGAILSSLLLGEKVLQTRYVVALGLIAVGIVVVNGSFGSKEKCARL